MKRVFLAIALTTSAAALAQTEPEVMTTPTEFSATPSTGQIQAPSNANPERDARNIPVISDAAMVPSGYNGTPATTGVGGPAVDPATGEAVSSVDRSHPPCSRTITDNCVQTYERGRSPQ